LNSVQDVWRLRHTIVYFAISELKLKYRGTVLGFLWTVIEPLAQLLVLYVVFTAIRIADEEFVVYLFTGLIMLHFFNRSSVAGLNSIAIRKSILLSLNVPKLIFPISQMLTNIYILAIEIVIFFMFLFSFGTNITMTIFIYPIIIALLMIFTLGVSLILAVIRTYFKDIQAIWAIVAMALLFITPIFWKISAMPPEVARIFLLNPLALLIESAHRVVLWDTIPVFEEFAYMIISSFAVLILGWLLFLKIEKRMVEKL